MINKKILRYTYILLLVIRVLISPCMIFFPVIIWGILQTIDLSDGFFAIKSGLKYEKYQLLDKIIDVWSRLFMVLSIFVFDYPLAWLFLILLGLRGIGEIIIATNGYNKQYFFLIFPDLVQAYYPFYILYVHYSETYGSNYFLLITLFIVLTILKLQNEYALHFLKWHSPLVRKDIK